MVTLRSALALQQEDKFSKKALELFTQMHPDGDADAFLSSPKPQEPEQVCADRALSPATHRPAATALCSQKRRVVVALHARRHGPHHLRRWRAMRIQDVHVAGFHHASPLAHAAAQPIPASPARCSHLPCAHAPNHPRNSRCTPRCPTVSPPPPQFLYDLVFEKDDPHFSGASKTHRDTKNRTMHTHDRNTGAQATTHNLAYQPPTDFSKPEHARKPLIRDTFYRKTNIFFPEGCAASTGAE